MEGPDINIDRLLVNNQTTSEWKRTPLKTYSKKTSPRSSDGVSRYGRSHKPKMSGDFLSTDKKVSQYLRIETDNQMHYFPCNMYKDNKKTPKSPGSTPRKRGRPRKHPLPASPVKATTVVTNETPIKHDSSLLDSPSKLSPDRYSAPYLPVKYNDLQAPMPTSTQTLPLPTELMGLKEELLSLKDEMPSDSESVCEDADWNCGDLAWANIGGFPYWPCTLTKDPHENVYKKNRIVGKGRQNRLFLHVRFFGDRGRRSWVVSNHIMPFQGLDSFQTLVDETCTAEMKRRDPRMYKAFYVGSSMRKAWQAAVSEAESLIESPRSERIIYFHNLYPPTPIIEAPVQAVVKKKPGRKRKNPLVETPPMKGEVPSLPGSADATPPIKKPCPDGSTTQPPFKTIFSFDDNPKDNFKEELDNNNELPEEEEMRSEEEGKDQLSSTRRQSKVKEISLTTPLKRKYTRRSLNDRRFKKNKLKASAETVNKGNNETSGTPGSRTNENNVTKTVGPSSSSSVASSSSASSEGANKAAGAQQKRRTKHTSGFEAYVDKHFDQICDENPHLTSLDVEKYLEKMWNDMNEHQKARYRTRTVEDSESGSDSKEGAGSEETSRSQSPQPITPATSKAPNKRGILLFAGVKADKVCQVCLKSGDILKCKGPCGFHYHMHCGMKDKTEAVASNASKKPLEKKKRGRPKSKNRLSKQSPEQSSILDSIKKEAEETVCLEHDNSVTDENQETTIDDVLMNNLQEETVENTPEEPTEMVVDEVDNCFEGDEVFVLEVNDNTLSSIVLGSPVITENIEKLGAVDEDPILMLNMSDVDENTSVGMEALEDASGLDESPQEGGKVSQPRAEKDVGSPKVEGAKYNDEAGAGSKLKKEEENNEDEMKIEDENIEKVNEEEFKEVTSSAAAENDSDTKENKSEKSVVDEKEGIKEMKKVKSRKTSSDESEKEFTKGERKNNKKNKEENESSARSSDTEADAKGKNKGWMCKMCSEGKDGPCFVCGKFGHERIRCCTGYCGKVYHLECAREWPQSQITQGAKGRVILNCPQHSCHTCISDNPSSTCLRFNNDRLVRCVKCPSAYHYGNYCIPAGTEILSSTQIVCPKHYVPLKKGTHHVNAAWCFICAVGGSLICCDWCPTSFHAECLKISPPEGGYICEDCETGRYPLFGEIVWVKLGAYRWWPAQILFPQEVPDNIRQLPHSSGEFAVKFFGSHDYYWVNRGRVFLYHEGDGGKVNNNKSRVDEVFLRGIDEASEQFKKLAEERATREAFSRPSMKPPKYVRIQSNKMTANVRNIEHDTFHLTPCECDPTLNKPCGPDSDCLNRLLMVECNAQVCPAGDRCCNQNFEKRLYPPLAPFRTETRGWGLKTLVALKKGDFVIEYVGEMIDEVEYQKRLGQMQKNKDENYYFLTIDKERMLDAGPKGNMARFMNHSCNPNCETQKWTVNGDTRIGLFTLCDVPAGTELVFNYNLETIGNTKVECKCGAPNCVGFIGAKQPKNQTPGGEENRRGRKKKKRGPNKNSNGGEGQLIPAPSKVTEDSCFTCGEGGELLLCDYASCPKAYHLTCLGLTKHPAGGWVCPWHQCSVCSANKVQRCTLCINSYCSQHAEGNISVHRTYGLLCYNHNMSDSGSDWSDKMASSEEEVKPQKRKRNGSINGGGGYTNQSQHNLTSTPSSSGITRSNSRI